MNIAVEQAVEATPEVHDLGIAPLGWFGVVGIGKVWRASPLGVLPALPQRATERRSISFVEDEIGRRPSHPPAHTNIGLPRSVGMAVTKICPY